MIYFVFTLFMTASLALCGIAQAKPIDIAHRLTVGSDAAFNITKHHKQPFNLRCSLYTKKSIPQIIAVYLNNYMQCTKATIDQQHPKTFTIWWQPSVHQAVFRFHGKGQHVLTLEQCEMDRLPTWGTILNIDGATLTRDLPTCQLIKHYPAKKTTS